MSDSGDDAFTQPFPQGCKYLLDEQEDYDLKNDNYETDSSKNDSPPSASDSTARSTSDEDVDLRRSVFLRLFRRIKCLFKIRNLIPSRNSFFPKLRADLVAALANLDECVEPAAKKKRLLVREPESADDQAESIDDVAESEHSSDDYSDDSSTTSVIEVLSSDEGSRPMKRQR